VNGSGFDEWNLLVRGVRGFDGCVFHGFNGFNGFNGLALRACRKPPGD